MNEKLKKRNPYPLKIEGRGVEVSKTLFYAIGNPVGIPYCIKKPHRAGLHCGGKEDCGNDFSNRL